MRDVGSTISTLKGASQYLTIKVVGEIDRNKVVVLINKGSTHNLVDEAFVKEKYIKWIEFKGFYVATRN